MTMIKSRKKNREDIQQGDKKFCENFSQQVVKEKTFPDTFAQTGKYN
jgi:hypothetical protein